MNMQNRRLKKMFTLAAAVLLLGSALAMPQESQAQQGWYPAYSRYASPRAASFGYQHPYVKKALIGGGGGALLGAIISPEGLRGNGAVKGAMLGAGAGLGYEYLRRQGMVRW